MPQAKLDLFECHKAEYATPRSPTLITVGRGPRRVPPARLRTIRRLAVRPRSKR